ncbi:SCO family protein [Bordetella genomosp. 10]|uniref:SCO family protein n=2 Tax=Bordetella genomosp. 10 TaxID=1416804 RepID=A0A261RYY9_9BORD|nr:SCO family protein [Bordetella genomosp. 10]
MGAAGRLLPGVSLTGALLTGAPALAAQQAQMAQAQATQGAQMQAQAQPARVVYDIAGHLPDLRFSLSGAQGKTVTDADVRGRTVLLFFGYANCPDVCPTTMAQLTDVLGQLGEDAAKVEILFVSVDPHRDTPDRLQAYVNAFNHSTIGLTGTDSQIADLARRYRVSYQIEKPRPGADPTVYNVAHSRGVFVFDAQGRARLLLADSADTAQIVQGLKPLLK